HAGTELSKLKLHLDVYAESDTLRKLVTKTNPSLLTSITSLSIKRPSQRMIDEISAHLVNLQLLKLDASAYIPEFGYNVSCSTFLSSLFCPKNPQLLHNTNSFVQFFQPHFDVQQFKSSGRLSKLTNLTLIGYELMPT